MSGLDGGHWIRGLASVETRDAHRELVVLDRFDLRTSWRPAGPSGSSTGRYGSGRRGAEILVSCLGANARYLATIEPAGGTFALCDTMGGAIPLALGMAPARPERRVTALEGDGALLMNLGALVTVAAAAARNLTILLFLNHRYESSGGQPLPQARVDFLGFARASGLSAELVETAEALRQALPRIRERGGLLVLDTAFDPSDAIPPYSQRPPEIRERFAAWVKRHS